MQHMAFALLVTLLFAQGGLRSQGPGATAYENGIPTAPTTLRDATRREAARLAIALTTAQPQPPQQSWAGRHPVLLGTLIGLGTGVSVGAATGADNGISWTGWLLTGTGVGAWSGLIASAHRTPRLRYQRSSIQADVSAVVSVVKKLGVGKRITVKAVNAQEIRGKIQAIGQDQFAVTPDGDTTAVEIAYSDVQAVKGRVGLGTKVGIAFGIYAVSAMTFVIVQMAAAPA